MNTVAIDMVLAAMDKPRRDEEKVYDLAETESGRTLGLICIRCQGTGKVYEIREVNPCK